METRQQHQEYSRKLTAVHGIDFQSSSPYSVAANQVSLPLRFVGRVNINHSHQLLPLLPLRSFTSAHLIREVYHLSDPALDDELRALVAREKRDIYLLRVRAHTSGPRVGRIAEGHPLIVWVCSCSEIPKEQKNTPAVSSIEPSASSNK